MTTAAEPLVLSRREGAITHLTLNRPRAINALNGVMFAELDAALTVACGDGSQAIVLDGAGERGFCAGGDIKEIAEGHPLDLLSIEYRIDYRIATLPVPVVCLMDGITMGGGIGLGGHAAHRVVTERSRLAMPEVRIGIAPDIGGHLLLSQAPGRLGELLAVTAGEMTGADAVALGFADSLVPSGELDALREALAAGEDPAQAIARLSVEPPVAPRLAAREWWDPIAESALGGAPVVDDAAAAAMRLIALLEASDQDEAQATAKLIREMCPVSIAATLVQIDRTRRLSLSLAEVLEDDALLMGRIGVRPDFAEGVRAQVIDKDRNPKWSPARIEDLDPAELAEVFAPRRQDEPALGL